MMIEASAHRYAKAVYEAAEEIGKTEETYAQLAEFMALLEENEDLRLAFTGKSIVAGVKKAIVNDIFAGQEPHLAQNLLLVLIDKNRENIFPSVVDLYRQYQQQASGWQEADLFSACPLTKEQTEALAAALQRSLGKKIQFTTHIDESLIAGCKIIIDDVVIDGSVAHQLQTLRQQLAK
ncbi:MAG: ATP synthase F1 subunit delta [Firmicutes bacterium]|nr:ATP synthase F1 subunit delta [Bacillota bacterium]